MSNPNRPASRLQIRLPSTATTAAATVAPSAQQQQDSSSSSKQQQQLPKTWPKYSPKPLPAVALGDTSANVSSSSISSIKSTGPSDHDLSSSSSHVPLFACTDDIHVHHQITSLHFVYHHIRHTWSYSGQTIIYLSHVPRSSNSTSNNNHNNNKKKTEEEEREIAFHLRGGDGMKITKASIFAPRFHTNDNNNDTKDDNYVMRGTVELKEIETVEVQHHCPLDKILNKSPSTFTPREFYPLDEEQVQNEKVEEEVEEHRWKRNRRYEADTQYCRGGQGMMDALRCASIGSYFGEGRVKFRLWSDASWKKGMMVDDALNIDKEAEAEEKSEKDDEKRIQVLLKELWRRDLEQSGLDDNHRNDDMDRTGHHYFNGQCGEILKRLDHERGGERRKQRLDLVCQNMVRKKFVDKNALDNALKKNTSSVSSKQGGGNDNGGLNPTSKNGSSSKNAMGVSNNNNQQDSGDKEDDWAMGLKLVLEFEMDHVSCMTHLGGIHFCAPERDDTTTTPHVYTTSGIMGDHEGTRCWVPTIDSASSKHRATHELTVRVTADAREGLWPVGCGEHYGVTKTFVHAIPTTRGMGGVHVRNDDDEDGDGDGPDSRRDNVVMKESNEILMEGEMCRVLGRKCVDYIASVFSDFYPRNDCVTPVNGQVHVIPPENDIDLHHAAMKYELATSTWTSSIWSPCPSRSLGFAIGPFNVLYDPEYYSREDRDDDDEDEEEEDETRAAVGGGQRDGQVEEEDEEEPPTVKETAEKEGEGIRQVYFAMREERPFIHANVEVIGIDGSIYVRYSPPREFDVDLKKHIVQSVIGSTAGVVNRALSLMRDILSLPSYRTKSYTQIWIPDAVDGGLSCGTLHSCPEISCNCFLGGAILDSKLLHPIGYRLPFYAGGRVLQFAQARCAVRGWIISALPLGGSDDVGHGYIHTLIEKFIMSLYERAHGAYGEGGSKHGFFFSKRFAISSGLNSKNMDFLPVVNVEEEDIAFVPVHGAVGSLPIDERGTDQLWRNANNGTESHTSTLDEFSVNQLFAKDVLEGVERLDKSPPSMGWLGSLLSATFLTSNSTSSSRIGCGAVELLHPVGGVVYRHLKCKSIAKVIESRAGISNFVRVIRAAFIAGILEDKGLTQVDLPSEKTKKVRDDKGKAEYSRIEKPKPLFVLCVDELVKKGGLAHGSFIRSLRVLSGPIREPYLRGDLVDVTPKSRGVLPVQPEGFPNSFVRGSCGLYLRVGVHVEPAVTGEQQMKNNTLQAHVIAEPVIPDGGIAFGGPITMRIIEKGGQCRELVRIIETDGSRSDWGPITLYGEPVTTVKKQLAASGTIETAQVSKKASPMGKSQDEVKVFNKSKSLFGDSYVVNHIAFNQNLLHKGGYQALELIRLTNRTPLLWVRVDPHGLFDGRVALFQQDACLGEQLFHDGDASSQVEALRCLAERPYRVQGSVKVKNLYDVPVEELPVHLLADCLRGSVALHADLPHNPLVRSQAALAIAQWQNNKAPLTKNSGGWIGLNLLVQYLNERFFKDGRITSSRFCRVCLQTEVEPQEKLSNANNQTSTDSGEYQYLDMYYTERDRLSAIQNAKAVEREEDEEYRVRSAVVTAISCVRAKDGLTPPLVLDILEKVLQGNDDVTPSNAESLEEDLLIRNKKRRKLSLSQPYPTQVEDEVEEEQWFEDMQNMPYSSSFLVADALLALCYINARPEIIDDPSTGKQTQSRENHPCLPLMILSRRWLDWDLYKESIMMEREANHLSPIGRPSFIAPCAITALYSLALLRQSTTDSSADETASSKGTKSSSEYSELLDAAIDSNFYVNLFDATPRRSDATRAAAAQAVLCLCCASDRNNTGEAIGLLIGLEFALKRMLEPTTSPGLKQTLACLMYDACTGKICSTQRVAIMARCNNLIDSGNRFYNGPLGSSYGSECGASIHTLVSEHTMPAANAVNNGARRGLRFLKQAGGKPSQGNLASEENLVRVAKFATDLWRTINGELGGHNSSPSSGVQHGVIPITSAVDGICANDGVLRCSLLSLWQWLWPKGCIAVLRVQSWKEHEGTSRYKALGADEVMKIEDDEKEAAMLEDSTCSDLRQIISSEIDRQTWRGQMAAVRREEIISSKDSTANIQGLNYPLHIVQKDEAWKQGAWVASTASQRRAKGVDGGSTVSVTKLRLTVKSNE